MSCIQVTSCQLALNSRNSYHLSSPPGVLCITPTNTKQFSKTSRKLTSSTSTYQKHTFICLFGDKGKSENSNEASPWKSLEKAMGSLKKQSIEDVLKQQMVKQEYYDDGGKGGRNGPGGGSGGSDGYGESEDEGLAGSIDEVLQVTLATIGFVFLYIYIIDGEDITRLVQDFIKFLFSGKQSFRLRRVSYEWGRFFQRLNTKEEVQEDWLERAIINTPTWYDSPEKYKRILRSRLASRSEV
ncbi:uncharacterized protein LOC127810563 [Diospyros lotus]|uniref:uncharacterized protein LOC127810563 n=1 Tax=Diospyros lotus TaxID=55363 RepID=UPI0022545014|nr:uncharacterized protein LOC127810563 [Diospyros lotus]